MSSQPDMPLIRLLNEIHASQMLRCFSFASSMRDRSICSLFSGSIFDFACAFSTIITVFLRRAGLPRRFRLLAEDSNDFLLPDLLLLLDGDEIFEDDDGARLIESLASSSSQPSASASESAGAGRLAASFMILECENRFAKRGGRLLSGVHFIPPRLRVDYQRKFRALSANL